MRAGIRFDTDQVGFNCFNCSKASKYVAGDCFLPKKMCDIALALGADQHTLNMIKLKLLNSSIGRDQEPEAEVLVDGLNVFKTPPVVQIPREMITLEDGLLENEPQAIAVARYLLDKRDIQLDPTTVFVAITRDTKNPWLNRVILPVIMGRRVVALTGRDITGKHPKKYHTEGEKGKAIFNHDLMDKHPERPLFIFEGQFDALRLDGIATIGSVMSEHQLHWINACPRRKVVVPDRGKDGLHMVRQAIEQGWEISLPDIGSFKDVDAAIPKYGKLYCLDQLLSNIIGGDLAMTKAKLYCVGGA